MTHTKESLLELANSYPRRVLDPNASETRKTIEAAFEMCFNPGHDYTYGEIAERLEGFVSAVDGLACLSGEPCTAENACVECRTGE